MRNSSESFASISYSTVTSTGPSLGPVASTSLGFRQWSQVARSAVASVNREIRISTGDAAVPMAAATKENWVPRCPATYPQNALPAAHEPIYTSRKTASALARTDRKSTRLNSSHVSISYAVFCLKKKKKKRRQHSTYNSNQP